MNKKFISVVLAALMLTSTAAISASAAEVEAEKSGASGTIKFNMGDWNPNDKVSFYIWAKDPNGAKTLYGSKNGWVEDNNWGSKQTNGTKVEGEEGVVESYEINFDEVAGRDIFVIFYDQATGIQTYNCILSEAAIGQTAVMTGETIENPEDSEKVCIAAVFEGVDGSGPQKVITSTGNVVGTIIAPNENGANSVANYVYKFLGKKDKSGVECVTDEKVANAISEFGTTADDVWAEFQSFKGKEGYEEYDAKEADAKKFIKPTSGEEEKKDEEKKDDNSSNNSSNTSSNSSSKSSTTTTTGTASKTSTTTAVSGGSTSSAADAGAAAETGDTTGTATFAVILVAAAAAMILTRKKVQD